MLQLLYAQRSAAKRSITHVENLIAVLTQREGQEFLHVYHPAVPPGDLPENVTAVALRDLPGKDLSRFDGLLIGFSTLDWLQGSLITKGPYFYPIERVYLERGEAASLYRTMAGLSIELMRRLKDMAGSLTPEQSTAMEARALQMALPGMLQDRNCAGLVAVLPVGELNRFISRKSCYYLYLDVDNARLALEEIPPEAAKGWMIALEELSLLLPTVQPESTQFLDLRTVLRAMRCDEALQVTRKGLAHLLYRRSLEDGAGGPGHRTEHQQAYRDAAWALAVEYWLAQIECEDLVAICPHHDFERFLETGDSARIYRTYEVGGPFQEQTLVLNQSLRDPRVRQLPDQYGALIFALPGVQDLIRPARPTTGALLHPSYRDLCQVLYKAGHEKTLARSLWMLACDLLSGAVGLTRDPAAAFKILFDACSRACLIYNLSDPWEWRQGRWQLYLQGAYQTRQQVLKKAALENEAALDDYYQSILLWYGCAESDHLEKDLETILDRLRDFQHDITANPYSAAAFAHELKQARELKNLIENLLNRPGSEPVSEDDAAQSRAAQSRAGQSRAAQGRGAVQAENIPTLLRRAADLSQPLPLISPAGRLATGQLRAARQTRQSLYLQERDINRLIDQLRMLRADLEHQKRRLFIPVHEKQALDLACDHEITAIDALLLELESSAKLSVVLKNTWVDIHQPVHLTLEITNRGRVEASALEVILDQPRGFQLLDASAVREIALLNPNAPNNIEYHIRPERVGAELSIQYSFDDRSGQRHKDTWTTYLNVRSLDLQPFQIKVNRYQFGRPIQEINHFYGRRSELQNILSLLKAGGKQNLLLRGPRRMGKTSLLYMLKIAITDRRARRFFQIPPEWDPELDRVHPVFLSLHSFNLMSGGGAANQFFRTLLERLAASLNAGLEEQAQVIAAYEQREAAVGAVNAALEQIGHLLNAHPDQRIAVLLDEYDEVYQPGTGSLDRLLREFVSAEQRLTWIIASTMALFQEVKTISSPWFNVFMIIELSRLSEDAAVELVEAPSRADNIYWQSDAVLSLLAETGRHPAFTQLFCGRIIAYLNQMRTNYVLQEMVLSVAEQFVDEQETVTSHFEFYWEDTHGTGQLILLILDDMNQPLRRDEIRQQVRLVLEQCFGSLPRHMVEEDGDPIEWQEREFKSQIEWVEKITNAVSIDAQKRYAFTVPLFHRWLRRKRQYQDLLAETLEKIAREMENDAIHTSAP